MFIFNNIDEIVDNIWLGNNSGAEDIKDLKDKGIKKILTVMNQVGPNYLPEDGFIHKKYNMIKTLFSILENVWNLWMEKKKF